MPQRRSLRSTSFRPLPITIQRPRQKLLQLRPLLRRLTHWRRIQRQQQRKPRSPSTTLMLLPIHTTLRPMRLTSMRLSDKSELYREPIPRAHALQSATLTAKLSGTHRSDSSSTSRLHTNSRTDNRGSTTYRHYRNCRRYSLLTILIRFTLQLTTKLSPILYIKLILPRRLIQLQRFLRPPIQLPLLQLHFTHGTLSS